jgi:hypothetical protein
MLREASLAAYRELEASGGLGRLELLVTKDIAENGPTTQAETTLRLRNRGGQRPVYVESYQQRFSGLEDKQVIAVVGERVCRVLGKMATEWDLTGKMPIKVEKRATKVEVERQACFEVAMEVASDAKTEHGRRAAIEVAQRIAKRPR